jgi:transcriptional regulator with XRE-family HTH domain
MISPESVEPQEVDATATSSVAPLVEIPQTRTSLVKRVAGLRDRIQLTSSDAQNLHREINESDLDRRTGFKVRAGIPVLLAEVARQRGMSWSDLAEMVGVSVQAVRKWRRGEPAAGEHRLALARLAAFIELLSEMSIDDPVGWMEVPLKPGFGVRGLDLYAAGRIDLLLEWAEMRIDVDRLLDSFALGWRETYKLEYETFEAADGQLSIRRRK